MRNIPATLTVLAVVLLGACGRTSSQNEAVVEKTTSTAAKADSSPQAKRVTIAELLRDPKAYSGKEVEVKGVYSGICCEDDWFLKDGTDTIEVYATKICPLPSKKKIQSKVTVIGTVVVRSNQPALTSKELRFE